MTTTLKNSFDAFANLIGREVERCRDRKARMRSLRAMGHVDNATLRDIGMCRAELMSVCLGGSDGRRRSHA